jgi:hypothetical protein
MNITDLIQSQLSGDVLNQLTKQIGAKDSKQTATAASGIVNVLVGALAQNAATPQGAESLSKALDRDHDGSLLGNVMGMLSGKAQADNKALNGAGILGHILGNRQSGAVEAVSKASGLNTNQVSSLMVALAPMIMSALGKTKKEGGLDTNGLVGMLSSAMSGMSANKKGMDPKMALIMSFLDRNRDAKASDDIFNLGKKFISNILGKK